MTVNFLAVRSVALENHQIEVEDIAFTDYAQTALGAYFYCRPPGRAEGDDAVDFALRVLPGCLEQFLDTTGESQ